LEQREAELNLQRVEQAIQHDVDQIARSNRNYGEWDDAYQFIPTRDPAFVRSNLQPEAFAALRLNLIHYYDLEGNLVWGETRDAADGTPISIRGLSAATFPPKTSEVSKTSEVYPAFPPRALLVHDAAARAGSSGVLAVADHLMLVASYPVLTSRSQGPARGTVVFGRLLTVSDENRLRRETGVFFSLLPLDSPPGSAGYEPPLPGNGTAFDGSPEGTLLASTCLDDMLGRPVRVLQAELPHTIRAEGQAVVRNENLCLLAVIVALILATSWSFGRFVVRPVQQLVRHILWIRQSGDLSRRLDIRRSDEVGTLASEFDLLLAQLARSRAARARSENQLRAILQDQTELIRRFLPDGTTTFVNRAYARYFGTSEEMVLGRKDGPPILEDDRELVAARLNALCEARPVVEIEHRVKLADGQVRWLHWTTRAILDHDGKVAEIQSVGRDVTSQKELSACGESPVPSGAAALFGDLPGPSCLPSLPPA
jgi:PAS domain S-box-containing protein